MNILKFVMARWAGEAHPAPSQKLLGSKVLRPKGASLKHPLLHHTGTSGITINVLLRNISNRVEAIVTVVTISNVRPE